MLTVDRVLRGFPTVDHAAPFDDVGCLRERRDRMRIAAIAARATARFAKGRGDAVEAMAELAKAVAMEADVERFNADIARLIRQAGQ